MGHEYILRDRAEILRPLIPVTPLKSQVDQKSAPRFPPARKLLFRAGPDFNFLDREKVIGDRDRGSRGADFGAVATDRN